MSGGAAQLALSSHPFSDLNAITYFRVNLPNDWIYL